jgi:cytochrome c oxidase subunit II
VREGFHPQSILDPAGPAAARIAELHWLLLWISVAVFALVLALLAVGLWRREAAPGTRFVVGWGVVFTTAVVLYILFEAIAATVALRSPGVEQGEPLPIRVVGHQWWWAIEYPELGITTANEIHLPVGTPVSLELEAADVIHSFWVPNLQGKMDLVPGTTNTLWLQADRPGVYRGQCAEFCGLQHALMALVVVALPEQDFVNWAEERRPAPAPPVAPREARGREVFFQEGCHLCHTIQGTPAVGSPGPDLTHVGSRRTLGAGTVPNTRENLAAWIEDPHPVKPGVLMPPTPLPREDLQALVRFLQGLR